ncbi:Peptidase M23 [Denitrovibrio acetiphilus DSM 12809]|uniref:Peptidase M23 n=1 Tax=Denitrovibrio acetiphilus (strain DSM 12809 / NBRC 114555 / N2460) TaxID=522772 RepID=D4H1J5_DENA2|nr:peptidoglycan DD-metalloendopeptidase family protein [Denitrovibrio acetiphilus]ADD68755.1 Peptidase M23 [Denitrovibrio acetiphilus DSM 12809]
MIYPYFLLNKHVNVHPVVRLSGDPLMIILDESMVKELLEMSGDSEGINDCFDNFIKASGSSWAVGMYMENRESILSQYQQMAVDRRYYHLGIDICAPAGTPVYAPLDGVVYESGYEKGEGNYGGYAILRHAIGTSEPFYSMYGHMSVKTLPAEGAALKAGDMIAEIGDLHENGGWNHHTHIQIITEKGREQGYFFKGYCAESALPEIESLCPSPLPLITAGIFKVN